jgi:hypothetical protein
VLRSVDNFTNGTISVKFKTIAGDADRASGILFNVKPNGDWLVATTTPRTTWRWEFTTIRQHALQRSREEVHARPRRGVKS